MTGGAHMLQPGAAAMGPPAHDWKYEPVWRGTAAGADFHQHAAGQGGVQLQY
jgi:hypothetical protein